jgi:hypothetical protein
MEKAVSDYLSMLDIPISEKFCKKRIASHPDYPSILAVSDTLQQLGITHTVARTDKKHPNQIPLPALLHIKDGGGSLLPVYEPGELDALADKLKSWSGVLLKAAPTERITDKENSNALKGETIQSCVNCFDYSSSRISTHCVDASVFVGSLIIGSYSNCRIIDRLSPVRQRSGYHISYRGELLQRWNRCRLREGTSV